MAGWYFAPNSWDHPHIQNRSQQKFTQKKSVNAILAPIVFGPNNNLPSKQNVPSFHKPLDIQTPSPEGFLFEPPKTYPKQLTGWWFFATPLKNMRTVKLGSSSPIFGVKIKNIETTI